MKKFNSTEWCHYCCTEQDVTEIIQPCCNCGKPLVACHACLRIEEGDCISCDNASKFVIDPAIEIGEAENESDEEV